MDHCRGIDVVIERGEAGEVYNIGGGNEVRNVDLTHMLLAWRSGPSRSSRKCRIARATTCATASTRRSFEGSAGSPRFPSKRSERHRSLVPRERMVVAPDQRGRSRVPRVLPDAVRLATVSGVLVTGARGFAGAIWSSTWRHRASRSQAGRARMSTCSIARPCRERWPSCAERRVPLRRRRARRSVVQRHRRHARRERARAHITCSTRCATPASARAC